MSQVTISSTFQVVIPKDVRERLKIRPGQKVEVFVVGERIELVPVRPMRELRGILEGVEAEFQREPDRDV